MPEREQPATGVVRREPRDQSAAIRAEAPIAQRFCVVGIGASAGGLDACTRFLAALPRSLGMVFILVQHMDPTHESMLVELLSETTAMPVAQATDGMIVEADHLYVIPPGAYLALSGGALHLSAPLASRGSRLPFDFLLHSLAHSVGRQAICVILSGSGADGSIGLKAIKEAGGLVIVQDPEEADYDGMPRSAILTRAVDFILPVDEIAAKLINTRERFDTPKAETALADIISLLRVKTPHDFTLYKPGTLERRIARRMAMLGVAANGMDGYLTILKSDASECTRLAEDLLINVTSFFRDPKIFETLASTAVPEIVNAAMDLPIRIWVAGCSTGEETYSLAILFREQIQFTNSNAKLQIFASDVDADAVAIAREAIYPAGIAETVSADRLSRFFIKEDQSYRISAEVRNDIVFAVQDVLTDPPFSKIDFVSCRNLMIYLQPEAQAKTISMFNFSLRKGGILLLGSAETVTAIDSGFSVISKPARLFRKTGVNGPGDLQFSLPRGEPLRVPSRIGALRPLNRSLDIGELCKRLVLENHSPAAVLINHNFECLYSLGGTERYLRVAQGYPTQDLRAMMQPALGARVKAAVAKAMRDNIRVVVPGGQVNRNGETGQFNVAITPAMNQNENLFLVCFVDLEKSGGVERSKASPPAGSRVTELEKELQEARAEIDALSQSLEMSNQEQLTIHEEALSVNEEFQSTNEELMTSKEELQSLNEELTALNGQLHETLERSRTTANDLQNVLYSTDVATLFLDTDLNIRFFTPASTVLFTLISSDIGRPLSHLHALVADTALNADALKVLKTSALIECDIEAENGDWYNRRILPYRTHDQSVAGVVITFTDITQSKKVKTTLKLAQLDAERANIAKSRFLAAASHDLRQPLQTLTLLTGLLAKITPGSQAQKLLNKVDETTNSMGTILNTLLDINQIDAGIVKPVMESFPINELLQKLNEEFAYVAEARGLKMHVVPCSLLIHTDPRILEQMMRNLLSNAMKYTKKGGVLLGCRRSEKTVRIEVWDSGLGIHVTQLSAIFDEYHQIDNAARELSLGLGLGLSIVQRLGVLLGHHVAVRSIYGKGSVFSIEAEIATAPSRPIAERVPAAAVPAIRLDAPLLGSILVIEDDPNIRQLLEIFLTEEGHIVAAASDGVNAVKLFTSGTIEPDVIIADYNLPNGLNGIQVIAQLRKLPSKPFSVIVCTGDISTETLKIIAQSDCAQMSKPMKLADLSNAVQHGLAVARAAGRKKSSENNGPAAAPKKAILIIDDDPAVRSSMRALFEASGQHVETFHDCETFLLVAPAEANACLLVDANLPGMSGIELLQKLSAAHSQLPAIMITGQGDVKLAVQAIKAGAFDFVEKPLSEDDLMDCVNRAFAHSRNDSDLIVRQKGAFSRINLLTSRQRQVLKMVLAGHPSKNIAADLGISQRTVENHRASIMEKTGTKSIPALTRLAVMAAGLGDRPESSAG